ncbi:cytochrome c oxidase assembly protein [Plantibacter flavus]|uniref:cytochrome c oxidase assembly protein n=1 Tax=Plantibacter flavus TaxID=150123 RepID=UPI00195FA7C9|nr:cytochrome c oxidase assembly protein [Plantibacter flavus]
MLLFKTVLLRFALTPTAGLIAVRLLVLLLVAALASALIARLLDASSPDASRAVALRHLWPLALTAAVYIGVTVAMTRIPPPQYFMPVSAMEVLFGFEMLKTPTLAILFGEWRGNILFAVVGAVAVILYLGAVIRLRRRGDAWPVGRTVAWVLGWAVIVFATSSGFGSYSGPSFSIHMMVHMGLNMFGPVLLAMGGVVTLLLRATPPAKRRDVAGPHEWLIDIIGSPIARLVFNPILVFLVFVGSYYALYLSPLFEEAMRFHWSHQLMNIHFLVSGYLFYSLIIGVDRPPRPLPHLGKLGFVLAAMPFHAFFGVIVMTSTTLIAGNFYAYMRAPWHDDLLADQHLGGGIAWAAGEIPLLIVVIALCLQWARQDDREAKRKDRHLDSGVDEDFDAYNDMLKHLADRGRLQPQQPTASAQRKDTGS